MKKYIQILYGTLLSITFICVLSSCSDDPDDILSDNPSDEEVVEVVLNKASTSWNSSVEQIKKHMNGYHLVDSDENFLQYTDKSGLMTISYSFSNDSLMATATIVPQLSDIDLAPYLQGYTSLGELSSKHVYYNNSVNTMCFSYNTKNEETYYTVLGFTPITSDLYATVNPIIVTTSESTNIGATYTTIKGSISGVAKSCTCGVRYSTDREFTTSSSRTTTSKGDYSVRISSLKRNTLYYFQCYCVVDGITYYGDTMSFTTLQ